MENGVRVIGVEEARGLLKRAVEMYGEDWAYIPVKTRGTCYYAPRPDLFGADDPRGQSGCLVGTALELGGVNTWEIKDVLSPVEGLNPDLRGQGVQLTNDAAFYLAAAQDLQDEGATWGEALYAAELLYDTGLLRE